MKLYLSLRNAFEIYYTYLSKCYSWIGWRIPFIRVHKFLQRFPICKIRKVFSFLPKSSKTVLSLNKHSNIKSTKLDHACIKNTSKYFFYVNTYKKHGRLVTFTSSRGVKVVHFLNTLHLKVWFNKKNEHEMPLTWGHSGPI